MKAMLMVVMTIVLHGCDMEDGGSKDSVTETLPVASRQAINQAASIGDEIIISAIALREVDASYQWQKDGIDLVGKNSALLPLNSISEAELFNYSVKGENAETYFLPATLNIIERRSTLVENYQSFGAPIQLLDSAGIAVGNNMSGITWHEGISQYLVLRNNYRRLYRYDSSFHYIGEVNVEGDMGGDTEGLSYVSGNEVLVSTEQEDFIYKVTVDSLITLINSDYDAKIGSPGYLLTGELTGNSGLEGVAFSPETDARPARVYASREKNPMKIFRFNLPPDPEPMALFTYDTNLIVEESFVAEIQFSGVITDIAGMVFDKVTGHLFVLSQESHKVLQVDPDTGAILSTLNLSGSPQYEGITIGSDGEIVVVSEPHWIQIYKPLQISAGIERSSN